MNSAAELKRHNESQAFTQAKDKIVNAILNDPLGLSINQIMTVCKLSVKTVKTILQEQCFDSENGVYFLKDQTRIIPELSTQPQKVSMVKDNAIETETITIVKPRSYTECMHDMFRYNPDGVTLDEALNILGGDRKKFDARLCLFKKAKYMVELKICADGVKRYVPKIDSAPAKSETIETSKKTSSIKQSLTISEVSKLKENITVLTTTKKELSISREQLTVLLRDLFGLSSVTWSAEGSIFVGVELHEVVTV